MNRIILILVLMLTVSISYGQLSRVDQFKKDSIEMMKYYKFDNLENKRKTYIKDGWYALGASLFVYNLGIMQLRESVNEPYKYIGLGLTSGFGIGLNVLAVRKFIKVRKINKLIREKKRRMYEVN